MYIYRAYNLYLDKYTDIHREMNTMSSNVNIDSESNVNDYADQDIPRNPIPTQKQHPVLVLCCGVSMINWAGKPRGHLE